MNKTDKKKPGHASVKENNDVLRQVTGDIPPSLSAWSILAIIAVSIVVGMAGYIIYHI